MKRELDDGTRERRESEAPEWYQDEGSRRWVELATVQVVASALGTWD